MYIYDQGWIDKLNAPRVEARGHPHPLPEVFLRITHISETILSILIKLCPNVPWVILFQTYVRYVWGPKKGPRGGLKWLIILIFKNHTCMTCLFFSFLLIYKTRPNDFDLQLGCCISDAFSILMILISCKWNEKQTLENILKKVFYIRYLKKYIPVNIFGTVGYMK